MEAALTPKYIFEEYSNKVYRLALSVTRNRDDARDVLQNTFLKILKNLKRFRGRANISTWIYRIAFNEALMMLRSRNRQFRLYRYKERSLKYEDSPIFVNWSRLPDRELLDKEFKENLELSIRRMDIKYRMPILLHNIEGLPIKEVSKILGLNINSLKTRLHRAYMIIRRELSDYLKDRQRGPVKQDNRCGIWTGFIQDYLSSRLDRPCLPALGFAERRAGRSCLSALGFAERRAGRPCLPADRQKWDAFDRHIDDCPNCKSFLYTYKLAIQITNAIQCHDIPKELILKIETFLSSQASKSKKEEKGQ